MKRAAVLIGVDRADGMPTLKDAAKGARRMEQWARSQEFDIVEVLTDENSGSVDIVSIKKTIKKIVEPSNIDQIVIYFAGHGVNIRYGEFWLLSDAPGDTQAAVNVQGSELLARYSGISHVVFISDACRTAAEGIREFNRTRQAIFLRGAPASGPIFLVEGTPHREPLPLPFWNSSNSFGASNTIRKNRTNLNPGMLANFLQL
ncbi:MAG: caspase family protein [Methylococcales bacterium]|nr:caspase family protein [Methylococcales bacterium]